MPKPNEALYRRWQRMVRAGGKLAGETFRDEEVERFWIVYRAVQLEHITIDELPAPLRELLARAEGTGLLDKIDKSRDLAGENLEAWVERWGDEIARKN